MSWPLEPQTEVETEERGAQRKRETLNLTSELQTELVMGSGTQKESLSRYGNGPDLRFESLASHVGIGASPRDVNP